MSRRRNYGILGFYAGVQPSDAGGYDRFWHLVPEASAGKDKYGLWVSDKNVNEKYADMENSPPVFWKAMETGRLVYSTSDVGCYGRIVRTR